MSDHLYIHIPFCLQKCRYCDFYSLEDKGLLTGFVTALKQEIRLRSESVADACSRVKTIYFGGGTPSLLSLEDLASILEVVHDLYAVEADAEITLEANPGTVNLPYFKGLKGLGINRLSLGIQSFSPDKLKVLGRIHTEKQGTAAIEQAGKAGFENIGVDLIYGVPGESVRAWQQEMKAALSHDPWHMSCYMLTLEAGTPLDRMCRDGKFSPMPGTDQVDLFSATAGFLEKAGYDQYEISNFARGSQSISRHNSAYWQMKPYTGFGPSAHSLAFGRDPSRQQVRSWNASDLAFYIKRLSTGGLPVEEQERLTPAQQMAELVMVGLRTRKGIDLHQFNPLSDRPFADRFSILINGLEAQGLGRMDNSGGHFCLTREGWTFLDSIVESFAREIL